MMRVAISSVDHEHQRYPTVGDWWRSIDGALQIRVSKMPDPRDMVLVALHEFVEAILCEHRGISEKAVTDFDLEHVADDDPWVADPGHCPDAPYHNEHVFAECVERLMARELGRNWREYEAALGALGE
jgi:hypothetical protein